MLRVALTGNLGSGKSAVSELFEEWGATVLDTDDVAREVVRPGSPALARIREIWGEQVIGADGGLDRAAMRRLAFADPGARRDLELILHPAIFDRARSLMGEAEAAGVEIFVVVVPLLYEGGFDTEFDVAILIDAPLEQRITRIVASRDVDEEEARRIAAAQMPAEKKRGRADVVIENDGDLATLAGRAHEAWEEIAKRGVSSRGPLRLDLHIHTRASFDCLSDYADVVATARERGLHRIAVTDHNEIEGAFRTRDLAPELVIVGEEVKTAEGVDVTGLFLSEKIPEGTPAGETVQAIHEQGGLVYMPHPFAAGKGGGGKILEVIGHAVDAVEIFNARIHRPELNELARRWAAERDIPGGAGSDAHTLREIGRGVIEVPAFADSDSAGFLTALRQGQVVGRTSSRWVHLASTWAKIAPQRRNG